MPKPFFFQKEYLTWQKTLMRERLKVGGEGDDRGWQEAWHAAVQGVAKSWTRLDNWRTTTATTSHACFTMSDQVLLHTHTHTKWFVTPAWTCSFHQDEGLDDTGWTLIWKCISVCWHMPSPWCVSILQFIFCSEFFWLTFYSSLCSLKQVPFLRR